MSALPIPLETRPEYVRLLTDTLPSVIHSEEQHAYYLQKIEELLDHEQSMSLAETELLGLLTLLVEKFEDEHFELDKSSPIEAVEFLMDQHGLKQKDLADIFGAPSIVSEVLSGKRELNKEHIRRLSEYFHVSPEIFF